MQESKTIDLDPGPAERSPQLFPCGAEQGF